MRRIFSLWGALMILSAIYAPMSWARLTVAPHLSVREEYNDNIYLSPSGRQNDFISTVRPGLAISWPTNYLRLNLDYSLSFLIFKNHPDLNETSLSKAQRGLLNAVLFPGRDFSITVNDEITRVAIDERLSATRENLFLNKTSSNHLSVNPRYRFHSIPTVEAILGYRYENYSYQSARGDDSTTHVGTFDLTKSLSPRLKLLLNYAIQFHQARLTEDYQRQDLLGGFTYRLGPRLTFNGKGGATRVDFTNRGNHTFANWEASLDFQATERASYSFGYSNSFLVSVDNGLYQRQAVILVMGYKAKISSDLRLFAQEDTYRSVNRKDRSAGATAGLYFPLTEDLGLNLDGNYTYYRFLPEMQDDQRFGAGGTLRYAHNIFSCSLGYVYQRGLSDVRSNEYINNIIYVQLGINFAATNKNNQFLSSIH